MHLFHWDFVLSRLFAQALFLYIKVSPYILFYYIEISK